MSNDSRTTSTHRNHFTTLIFLFSLVFAGRAGHAAARYTLIPLTDGFSGEESRVVDINEHGVVLVAKQYGWYLWHNGTVLGRGNADPLSLNNSNVVAGSYSSNGTAFGTLWKDGVELTLQDYPGPSHYFKPYGMNNVGQIVGYSQRGPSNAVFWDEVGSITDMNVVIPGFAGFAFHDINDSGVAVGRADISPFNALETQRAFIWKNGTATLLPVIHNKEFESTSAVSINESSRVVGYYSDQHLLQPATWYENSMTLLPTPPGEAGGAAIGINDQGFIVGSVGNQPSAAMWTPDGQFIRVADLVDNLSSWDLKTIAAINNRGWMIGGGVGPDGVRQGFLLIPTVPEPSSMLLLIASSVCLSKRRRRP